VTIKEFIESFNDSEKYILQEFFKRVVINPNDRYDCLALGQSLRFNRSGYFSANIDHPFKREYFIVSSDKEADEMTINEKETINELFELGLK